MHYFTKLFVKAPFDLLQLHMEKVVACLAKLSEIFKIINDSNFEEIEALTSKISQYEHEADLIKNDIRASLPRNFLFPME